MMGDYGSRDDTPTPKQAKESPRRYCAWLLREVWGKGGNLRREEAERIEPWGKPEEPALDLCLRLTGTHRHYRPFSEGARRHYQRKAQKILNEVCVMCKKPSVHEHSEHVEPCCGDTLCCGGVLMSERGDDEN